MWVCCTSMTHLGPHCHNVTLATPRSKQITTSKVLSFSLCIAPCNSEDPGYERNVVAWIYILLWQGHTLILAGIMAHPDGHPASRRLLGEVAEPWRCI